MEKAETKRRIETMKKMETMQCKECCRDISKEVYEKNNGYCNICYADREDIESEKKEFNKEKKSETQYIDSSNSSNIVAKKFKLVVKTIKIIGYVGAVIIAIMFMSIGDLWVLTGFLSGIAIAITTWFSTLLFEAIAEGLNLLQDIKNKL